MAVHDPRLLEIELALDAAPRFVGESVLVVGARDGLALDAHDLALEARGLGRRVVARRARAVGQRATALVVGMAHPRDAALAFRADALQERDHRIDAFEAHALLVALVGFGLESAEVRQAERAQQSRPGRAG